MKSYLRKVHDAMRMFAEASIRHIPEEKSGHVDALATLATTLGTHAS